MQRASVIYMNKCVDGTMTSSIELKEKIIWLQLQLKQCKKLPVSKLITPNPLPAHWEFLIRLQVRVRHFIILQACLLKLRM